MPRLNNNDKKLNKNDKKRYFNKPYFDYYKDGKHYLIGEKVCYGALSGEPCKYDSIECYECKYKHIDLNNICQCNDDDCFNAHLFCKDTQHTHIETCYRFLPNNLCHSGIRCGLNLKCRRKHAHCKGKLSDCIIAGLFCMNKMHYINYHRHNNTTKYNYLNDYLKYSDNKNISNNNEQSLRNKIDDNINCHNNRNSNDNQNPSGPASPYRYNNCDHKNTSYNDNHNISIDDDNNNNKNNNISTNKITDSIMENIIENIAKDNEQITEEYRIHTPSYNDYNSDHYTDEDNIQDTFNKKHVIENKSKAKPDPNGSITIAITNGKTKIVLESNSNDLIQVHNSIKSIGSNIVTIYDITTDTFLLEPFLKDYSNIQFVNCNIMLKYDSNETVYELKTFCLVPENINYIEKLNYVWHMLHNKLETSNVYEITFL